MVLNKKETTVAYRCPKCGSFVTSIVGIFSLTADMVRLKCPCGGSYMEIEHTKEDKVNMVIPCIMCPSPHRITISSSSFFEKDLFEIPCSFTGLNIAFIGKQYLVAKAEEEADRVLQEILGDNHLENTNESDEIFDPQLTEVVLSVLNDLDDEHKIYCSCGECPHCSIEIYKDYIRVICDDCGDSLNIPTISSMYCNDFINTEELLLGKDK